MYFPENADMFPVSISLNWLLELAQANNSELKLLSLEESVFSGTSKWTGALLFSCVAEFINCATIPSCAVLTPASRMLVGTGKIAGCHLRCDLVKRMRNHG